MHYYQPMWTMVAGHLGFKAEDSERPMGDIIPKGAEWHRDGVATFHPEHNKVKLASGKEVRSFGPLIKRHHCAPTAHASSPTWMSRDVRRRP